MKYFSKKIINFYMDKKNIIPSLNLDIDFKINIILSPEFYWIRVFTIPVKYEYEANKLLPTLFEDILEHNEEYEYKSIKIDTNKFISFAYNKTIILQTIKEFGISQNQISNVYFAQTEIKQNVKINQEYSLVVLDQNDQILSKIPNSLTSSDFIEIREYLKTYTPSKYAVSLDYFANIIDPKNAIIISIILCCLGVVNFIKIYYTSTIIKQLQTKETKLITQYYSLPPTSFQTKAIINKYENIYLSQQKLRKKVKKRLLKHNINLSFTIKAKNEN